jgi:hypothetical protein
MYVCIFQCKHIFMGDKDQGVQQKVQKYEKLILD